jgi:DNA helicase-2/ATP-dependent DNA helicase PcrA
VFAVAGAGKTTAMVHRVERLVRDGLFPASRILATSFAKGNELDLRLKLARWPHCRAVQVRTLHALGRSIIVQAQEAGHWPELRLGTGDDDSYDPDQRLLTIAIHEARQRLEPYAPELEAIDRHDFLSYVAACKGNLQYADLQQAGLPAEGLSVAAQAEAPNAVLDWYLDLYRLYEAVRLQRGVVTFADMLLTGWETLVRHPDMRQAVQEQVRCVLVDEFQDINLAQYQILDQITAPHHNYMVNRRRAPKRLHLTRGFEGETKVELHRDPAGMAGAIVSKIRALHEQGLGWGDIAVLVRLNAQTPYIEQGLIAAEIPFRVSNPFYNRYEIRTLVHYVRVAWVEWALQTGKKLTGAQKEWFAEAWQTIYNRPKRYLSRQIHDLVSQAVLKQGASPTVALRLALPQVPHDGIAANLELLADDVAWLAVRLQSDAATTLRELEVRLDYKTYLHESSGFPQTGEGRAAGVDALVDYARGKGPVLDFVQHLRQLARQKIGREAMQDAEAVALTTIHGAKGLEWPAVFVAQCNQGTMPFNGERTDNPEEERRLFYVALTRSSRHLYLHAVKSQPLSPFLHESGWRQVLPALQDLKAALRSNPQSWRAEDAWNVARGVARYDLERYFRHWWNVSPRRRRDVACAMQRFLAAVAAHDAWRVSVRRRSPSGGRVSRTAAVAGAAGESPSRLGQPHCFM